MDKSVFNRVMAALLVCLLVLPLGCRRASATAEGSLRLASEAAILMDAETGQILYEKNMYKPLYPASITKVLTGLLALESLSPEQVLTVSQTAVNAVPRTSSHIALQPGEQITVEQAMYALGMESANDAANVLAEAVSGSLEEFARRMTEKAFSLGARNSQFTNANGLPDSNHYTSAYDMALITAAALKVPEFTRYFSTVEYLFAPTNLSDARPFTNKDRLLPGGQYYYEGVLMAKTGWTTAAQGTFVAAVRRGDTTLIAVTLKSPLLEDKYRDTRTLMDFGFSQFQRVTMTGEALAERLPLGNRKAIEGQTFSFLLSVGTDVSQIAFTLSPDSTLPRRTGSSAAITVNAAIGDLFLPDLSMVVGVPKPDLEKIIPEVEEVVVEAVVEAAKDPRSYLVIALGALSALAATGKLHKFNRRRIRRNKLRAKIERMKRRME